MHRIGGDQELIGYKNEIRLESTDRSLPGDGRIGSSGGVAGRCSCSQAA